MESNVDDIIEEIYIPECCNGILSINGNFYISRRLCLDNMNLDQKTQVVNEIYDYIYNNNVTTLVLNFKFNDIYFYTTKTQINMICKILKCILVKNVCPFTIDINDNMFYNDTTLDSLITQLEEKNFNIRKSKIYLHHSLHTQSK